MTENEIRALLVSAGAQISPGMDREDLNFVLRAHLTALKHLLRERDHGHAGEVEFHPAAVKPKDMLDPAEQAVEDFEDHIDAQQRGVVVEGPDLEMALGDRFNIHGGAHVVITKAEHERLLQAERDLNANEEK